MAIELSDLEQFNEVEEIDGEASSFDAVPPPPPGIHTVKLSVVEEVWKDQPKAATKDGTVGKFEYPEGKQQLMIFVEIAIDEPGQPGHGQSIRELVNTMVDQNLHTSDVDTYLRLITGSAGVGLTQGLKMIKLVQALTTNPILKAETEWEARLTEKRTFKNKAGKEKEEYPLAKKDGKVLSSYANFPNGKPVTEDDDGAECRTRFKVKKLFPASA